MVTPVAEGIESQGVQVLTRSVEQVTWEEMLATDGIVVGNPTRFGGTGWQLKRLFDVTAIMALVLTSAIGGVAGSFLSPYVNATYLRLIAGLGFIGIGIWTLITA